MEKDVGKITKNDNTDIVVRVDDFGGKPGVTIREFTTSERYTGFTKSGTRIPADKFLEFRELINKISLNDLKSDAKSEQKQIEDSGEEVEDY
ncbi:hypothetical protein J4205_03265 [Candidatus Pacearchaeota archaeon]|nr:hypothetical protein [Candidatus Pacearchaeota archaeon]